MDFWNTFPLLNPQGAIGLAERGLMVQAVFFMLIVAVPVFALTFFIAWRYRAGNTKAVYHPDWEHSALEELVWWAIPLEIILILGALAWGSTHALDPYKPIVSQTPPIQIEVVSLQWKWLFIYPAQGIASVNYLAIPAGVPVVFKLTSDAPMNAFWIPQLGGMEMTMPGMVTTLNLIADTPGTYLGESSNYSGEGFADMQFKVDALPQADFDTWVMHAQMMSSQFDFASYQKLAAPGTTTPAVYTHVSPGLYNRIIMQYLAPAASSSDMMPSMPL